MINLRNRAVVSIVAGMCAGPAIADTNFRALMMEAMRSPSGKSTAVVAGPAADNIRAQIGRPDARIMAEVSIVEKLPQEGCKRLLLRFTTPGTLLPTNDGKSQMLDMGVKLNMCPNGLPPQ